MDASMNSFQRTMRRLPSPPRCKLCQAPFNGLYAPLLRLIGFCRWALNQQICRPSMSWLPSIVAKDSRPVSGFTPELPT
jgi:hypothetical protein